MKVTLQAKLLQEIPSTAQQPLPETLQAQPQPRERLSLTSSASQLQLKHSYEAFIVGYLDEEDQNLQKLREHSATKVAAEGKNEGNPKSNLVDLKVPWKYEELDQISNLDIVHFLLNAGSENFIVTNGLDGKLEDVAKKLSKVEATKLYRTLVETKQFYSTEEGIFARFPKELCIYVRTYFF